jgi:hypothetical protein
MNVLFVVLVARKAILLNDVNRLVFGMDSHYVSCEVDKLLPVALYGCETWFLTLREEHRLRVFETGPKRDEMTGDWRKLHHKELHNLYSSPNLIRMIRLRRMS